MTKGQCLAREFNARFDVLTTIKAILSMKAQQEKKSDFSMQEIEKEINDLHDRYVKQMESAGIHFSFF